jgi:hypothetical protein
LPVRFGPLPAARSGFLSAAKRSFFFYFVENRGARRNSGNLFANFGETPAFRPFPLE